METQEEYYLVPGVRNSFKAGWRVMMNNFLSLLLVIVILSIIASPYKMFNHNINLSDFHGAPWNYSHDWGHNLLAIGTLGIFAAFFGLLAMLYSLLVKPIFNYGGNMIFVKAVRKSKIEFEYLIKGFRENYLNIVFANLLVFALVILGFFALIIPGIIIGCRLIFTSYIIMDKKLDPIEAVELSWKLTRGHGWQIFLMIIASFFIIIFGLMLLVVGIFPAIVWIESSFASLYESVLREKEPRPEEATEHVVI